MALNPSRLLVAALLATAACSSSGSGSGPTAADPVGPSATLPVAPAAATTWVDGMVLRDTVTVPAGTTVTLAPGAALTAVKGARLVVAGTLVTTTARISGKEWGGITVAKGGRATLAGLTLTGADEALTTETGALPSTFSGAIRQAQYPLTVEEGSTLTLDDVAVEDVSGASSVDGTLVARHLTYDKGGNAGMVISGTLRLADSHLYGNGDFDGDFLTTDDAAELTVTDTEIRDVHCAFHLVGVDKLALSGLDVHDNAYGFMAYGSKPGVTHTITDSDVYDNRDFALQETPGVTQGRILVDGGFWDGKIVQASGKVERVNPAARPRSR